MEINIEYHSLFRKLTPQLIRTVNGVKVVKKDEKQNVPQEVVPEVSKKDIKKEAKLTKQQQEQLEQ